MTNPSAKRLLRKVMAADEGVKITQESVNALKAAGLVTLRGCSDGDYIEPTAAGRIALGQGKDK